MVRIPVFLLLIVIFQCSYAQTFDKVKRIIIHTAPFLVVEGEDTILVHPIYGIDKDEILKYPYVKSYKIERRKDISNILKLCNKIKESRRVDTRYRFVYKVLIEGFDKRNRIKFSLGIQRCGLCILDDKYKYEGCDKDFLDKLRIYVPNLRHVILW